MPRRADYVDGARSRPASYLPPRRSLPTQPQSSAPLDYIPPSRSQSRGTRGRYVEEDEDEEYLSADEATRIMMQKWDLLDSTVSPPPDRTSSRDGQRRQPIRSSSAPSTAPTAGTGRRKSRVREWEKWKPEMERIRLAQVEMEKRMEEEAREHQLASMRGDGTEEESYRDEAEERAGKGKKKLRERKSTPRYPRRPSPDAREDSDERELSPTASIESTKAVYDDSETESKLRRRGSRRRLRIGEPRSRSTRPPSRRAQNRRPVESPSPNPPPPLDSRRARTEKESDESLPLPVSQASAQRSRSRRRKPRPRSVSPPPSKPATPVIDPSPTPPSTRQSRSSRNRKRPSPSPPPTATEDKATRTPSGGENDLLSTATLAAEQVSEAVTNAFTKVIPGLFGMKK
ncbi:uncharacterized protein JCM6883_002668 [Sporobolomyces salmoneus]|uniref:uncharacterized protein n=1 Tax=Sporobolomyces salmoneus TaxID=183962 RepID=UPI00317B57F4